MLSTTYLRPIAYHEAYPHRLLLNDEQGQWCIWMGDDSGLVELAPELADWILQRPEIVVIDGPAMWFDIESLPLGTESHAG